MKIEDFMRRWALHYINPDFLKIPTGDSGSRVLLISFQCIVYNLKSGGYGEYISSINTNDIEGYLYQQIINKETGNISYKVFNDSIRTEYKNGEYYYSKNQYWTFSINNNNLSQAYQFCLPRPGVYYFLLKKNFTKHIDEEHHSTDNISTDFPAHLYEINITREIFDRYSVSRKINGSSGFYDITLYKYHQCWKGFQCLPNINEPIAAKITELREYYSVTINKNGSISSYTPKLRELVCCDFGNAAQGASYDTQRIVDGHNISPKNSLALQDENYLNEPNDIALSFDTFDIKYKSRWSNWEYLDGGDLNYAVGNLVHHFSKSESQTVSPYQRHELLYILDSNDTISVEDKKTLYAHDHKKYGVFKGTTQTDVDADFEGYIKEGLYFDDNVQTIEPLSIDDYFYGWAPEAAIIHKKASPINYSYPYVTYEGYQQYNTSSTSLYRSIAAYEYAWWPNPQTYSFPSQKEDIFQGEGMLFYDKVTDRYYCISSDIYGEASYSYPGAEGLYGRNENININSILFRYGSPFPFYYSFNVGRSISYYSLPCIQHNYHMQGSHSVANRYGSNIWYQSSNNYVSLREVNIYTNNYIYNIIWEYDVYTSANVNDYTTWSTNNIFTTKEHCWGEYASSPSPQPPAGYSQINKTYLKQIYPLLSPELQEYLGFGTQDFTIEALSTTLNEYGAEIEIEKQLNTIAAPKDVL